MLGSFEALIRHRAVPGPNTNLGPGGASETVIATGRLGARDVGRSGGAEDTVMNVCPRSSFDAERVREVGVFHGPEDCLRRRDDGVATSHRGPM